MLAASLLQGGARVAKKCRVTHRFALCDLCDLRGERSVYEKRERFLKDLVEFLRRHVSNRVKNDLVLTSFVSCSKPCSFLVNEKRPRFLKYLIEFRYCHL